MLLLGTDIPSQLRQTLRPGLREAMTSGLAITTFRLVRGHILGIPNGIRTPRCRLERETWRSGRKAYQRETGPD
jgi:hypothetical protein